MKKTLLPIAGGVAFAAFAGAQTQFADSSAATVSNGVLGTLEITEIRIDQSGADNDEYFEISGTPGTALTGLHYVVLGDGSATTTGISGAIEAVVDLGAMVIPADGIMLVAETSMTIATPDYTDSLNFENGDTVTHMIVSGFTGSTGDDVDTNDDGMIDAPAWTSVIDMVSIFSPVDDTLTYGTDIAGPDGPFGPVHIVSCGGSWWISNFDLDQDTPGDANDCRGRANFCYPASVNSTGNPVTIWGNFGTGVGSDLRLYATDGPDTEFGYFLVGTAPETANPLPISNGFLCLSTTGGNAFGRYNVNGSPLNSIGVFDASGDLVNAVGTSTDANMEGYDVPSTIPLGANPTIMSGETWYFQLWYRDGATGTGNSNLSNGLAVLF